jgi:hypothetical protein
MENGLYMFDRNPYTWFWGAVKLGYRTKSVRRLCRIRSTLLTSTGHEDTRVVHVLYRSVFESSCMTSPTTSCLCRIHCYGPPQQPFLHSSCIPTCCTPCSGMPICRISWRRSPSTYDETSYHSRRHLPGYLKSPKCLGILRY